MFHFRWAEKLDRLTSTCDKDPEGFVGHPVNAFKLMKRLNLLVERVGESGP